MPVLRPLAPWTEAAKTRVAFLRLCAEKGDMLARQFGQGAASRGDGPPSLATADRAEAQSALRRQTLVEAAGLAFCTGDTQGGVNILRDASNVPRRERPTDDPLEAARILLIAALVRVETVYDQYPSRMGDILFEPAESGNRHWPVRRVAEAIPLLRLSAGLGAYWPSRFLGRASFATTQRTELSIAEAAASKAPEFDILDAIDRRRGEFAADPHTLLPGAVSVMEGDYVARITLLQLDREAWSTVRPRADLIDWRLLAALVLLIEAGLAKFGEARHDATAFIRGLAREVANARRR